MPPADPRPTLLLTRPEMQSQRFAAEARARLGADWPVLIAPLSGPRLLSPVLDLAGVRALIFTSETGVAAFARLSARRDLPAWCVGPRTAAAARALGLTVRIGPGDGQGLARLIRDSAGDSGSAGAGGLLHAHGRDVAVDLAGLLGAAGFAARGVVVYEQAELPLSAPARALVSARAPVLLPLFSPRAAVLAAQAIPSGHAPLLVAAISAAAAAPAEALAPVDLRIAREPNGAAMLEVVAQLAANAAA